MYLNETDLPLEECVYAWKQECVHIRRIHKIVKTMSNDPFGSSVLLVLALLHYIHTGQIADNVDVLVEYGATDEKSSRVGYCTTQHNFVTAVVKHELKASCDAYSKYVVAAC